jgi:urease accessory protein
MTDLAPMTALLRDAPARADARVVLDYDARLMRRKRLVTDDGRGFLVDLPEVTNLDAFWGFELADGTKVQIIPACEELVEILGDLPRLAWHIGNRHTPCQIEARRLLIRRDHVLEAMLAHLGAHLHYISGPFMPEGGAYGHGRTMGHAHGDHDHGHSHAHAHSHHHHD